jgi:hypothetical protein
MTTSKPPSITICIPLMLLCASACGRGHEATVLGSAADSFQDAGAHAVVDDRAPNIDPRLDLLGSYGALAQIAKEGQVAQAQKELEAEAVRLANIDPSAAAAAFLKLGARSAGAKGRLAALREPLLAGMQEAAALHPTPQRLAELGRELFRQGRFAEAERTLAQWAELQPDVGPLTAELLCWRAAAAELAGGSRGDLVARAVAAQQELAAAKASAEAKRVAEQEAARALAEEQWAAFHEYEYRLEGANAPLWILPDQQRAQAEARANADRVRMDSQRQDEQLYEQQRRQREIESFYERRIRALGGG